MAFRRLDHFKESGMSTARLSFVVAAAFIVGLAGCGQEEGKPVAAGANGPEAEKQIEANLAKLSPEDRKLAEAQKFCPLMPGVRLGAKGTPRKITSGSDVVFVCCAKCEEVATKDPAYAVAKLKEMKK